MFIHKFEAAHWTSVRNPSLIKCNIRPLKLIFLFSSASK